MILIYDFDGTLTPYSLPQYEILKSNGYSDKEIMQLVTEIMKKENKNLYQAYYTFYENILKKLNIKMVNKNIYKGADKTEFNTCIPEFFEFLSTNLKNIKHYVITSGFKVYVENTSIAKYLSGVYGTTYSYTNGIATNIDYLMDENEKVIAIKKILSNSTDTPADVFYFGDGLTDKKAFEYVKKIGGKSILISKDKYNSEIYQKLKSEDIITNCFEPDFSINSNLCKYIILSNNEHQIN